jgi:hypothetical protein
VGHARLAWFKINANFSFFRVTDGLVVLNEELIDDRNTSRQECYDPHRNSRWFYRSPSSS